MNASPTQLPRLAIALAFGAFGLFGQLASAAGDPASPAKRPIVLGNTHAIHSRVLGEDKLLHIYLPESYSTSQEKYPVVYQLYSHFLHAYYLPAIRATHMGAAHGKFPEMIVVGIENAEFRYRDLLPEDHYGATSAIDKYREYFETELIPFVDKNFRTLDYRVLAGPQAGASFGVYCLQKRPQLFNGYVLSNPFWVRSSRRTLLDAWSKPEEKKADYSSRFVSITFDESEGSGAREALNEFVKALEAFGPVAPQLVLRQVESSFDLSVSVGLERGLRRLFDGFEFPATARPQDLAGIQAHYRALSARLGLEVAPPEMALVVEGDKYMRAKNDAKALELFSYQLKAFPHSLMALDRMGGIHQRLGKLTLAIQYYEKFLERQPGNPRVTRIVAELHATSREQ